MNNDEKTHVNREYKDRLFKYIFGREEHKDWTLSLYNAINGSDHKDPDDIQFSTIEDVVYLGMKNDVSFLLLNNMIFWEQQSSVNPNLPARFSVYYGMSMNRFLNGLGHILYSTRLHKIPTPKCICFYNGERVLEDKSELKLSDAYEGQGDVELKVTVYNVNYGHNKEILNVCKPLMEYSLFVHEIRKNVKAGLSLSDAINKTVNEFPKEALLKDFLVANKSEVLSMCITEYDEQAVMEGLRKEAYDEGVSEGISLGISQGISLGKEETLISMYKKGFITLEDVAEELGISAKDFLEKIKDI